MIYVNHYTEHLQLMQYCMSFISQQNWERNKKLKKEKKKNKEFNKLPLHQKG